MLRTIGGTGELRATRTQTFLLTVAAALLVIGLFENDYGIVRTLVRFICTSCIGLG